MTRLLRHRFMCNFHESIRILISGLVTICLCFITGLTNAEHSKGETGVELTLAACTFSVENITEAYTIQQLKRKMSESSGAPFQADSGILYAFVTSFDIDANNDQVVTFRWLVHKDLFILVVYLFLACISYYSVLLLLLFHHYYN